MNIIAEEISIPRIFISYSRADKDLVYPFVADIENYVGVECWIDLNGIAPSDAFVEKIIEAINMAGVVVFMHSKNSSEAPFVKKEIQYALNKKKKVVLVLMDETPLNDYFLFQFGTTDYIDFHKKDQRQKLYRDIQRNLNIASSQIADINSTISVKKEKITHSQYFKRYKLGDNIIINGVEGRVFEVDSTGLHGIAVSMVETVQRWCVKNDIDLIINTNNKNNGAENMRIIQNLPLWEKRFPAFAWCKSLGPEWYLPSISEVESFIRKGFCGLNYNIERYWSSTEENAETAWYYYVYGGYPYVGGKSKNRYVRAVAQF